MRIVSASPATIFSKHPATPCGGILTEKRGIIQTPNFPNPFYVPLSCTWIIDASTSTWGTPNVSINVYLTQQYVLSGLIFKEYMYYSDDFKVPSQTETVVKEENVTRTASVHANSPFLEISFQLDNLYGTQLRVMDHLLDVYGFNITYEIGAPRANQCNSQLCSFLGNCYVTSDYK
jgi:ligand-binding sensor domain-containing protein